MNPKNMIFASDSFKGSLSQEQILNILEEAAREQFPDCECIGIPIADGGEGTARAIVPLLRWQRHLASRWSPPQSGTREIPALMVLENSLWTPCSRAAGTSALPSVARP